MSDPFEQVNQFIDALQERRKPKRFRVDKEDLAALKMASRLAALHDPAAAEPSPAFQDRLRAELAAATSGRPASSSRRGFIAAALGGLAAGAGAALGLSRVLSPAGVAEAPASSAAIVRANGRWFAVAKLSDLPAHAVVRFTAGALEGHLVRQGDSIVALSAICSHLPCTLVYQEQQQDFLCPCHDATFALNGDFKAGRRPYDPLTHLETRIEDGQVLVWSIGEAVPSEQATPYEA